MVYLGVIYEERYPTRSTERGEAITLFERASRLVGREEVIRDKEQAREHFIGRVPSSSTHRRMERVRRMFGKLGIKGRRW